MKLYNIMHGRINFSKVQIGETLVLECIASGSPKPYLTWKKNKGPLYPTERHFFTADNQLLIIVKVGSSNSAKEGLGSGSWFGYVYQGIFYITPFLTWHGLKKKKLLP